MPDQARLVMTPTEAIFDLNDISETIGPLVTLAGAPPFPSPTIMLGSATLTINQHLSVETGFTGQITGTGGITKIGDGDLMFLGSTLNTYTGTTTVNAGSLWLVKDNDVTAISGPVVVNGGTLVAARDNQFPGENPASITINSPGLFTAAGTHQYLGSLAGSGNVNLDDALIIQTVPTVFSGVIAITKPTGPTDTHSLGIHGTAPLTLTGQNTFSGPITLTGQLIVNGSVNAAGTLLLNGGTLGGSGSVGKISGSGSISPGAPGHPGVLHAASLEATSPNLLIDLDGPTAGVGYDQLELAANLTLPLAAALTVSREFGPRAGAAFTIVTLPAGKTITGTFANLPEGATLTLDGQKFSITYKGGDGNDIVVTALEDPPPISYFLSEGATGGFFDEDVLLANPNEIEAPVTLTSRKRTASR